MAEKDPAFLFYSKDWITDTAEYTDKEKSVLIDLMAYNHINSDLPNDINRLANMVSKSPEEFKVIWEIISKKFKVVGDRLVNRKLYKVVKERKDKAIKNTITGTFAAVLTHSKLSKEEREKAKELFNINDFIGIPKELVRERLTDWLSICLGKQLKNGKESIGNGNGNYINVFKEVAAEFSLNEKMIEIFLLWFKYKDERGQGYQETGMRILIEEKLKEVGEDANKLEQMVLYSIQNNFHGIYAKKTDIPADKKEWSDSDVIEYCKRNPDIKFTASKGKITGIGDNFPFKLVEKGEGVNTKKAWVKIDRD